MTTATEQQGDVRLFQTVDGGEIEVVEGLVSMGGGLASAVYLSLLGGNENDSTRDGDPANWWGNLTEQPARQYRSQFQYLLARLPAIPANLRRLEDAVLRDLEWMTDTGAATELDVSASMPGPKQVKIVLNIESVGEVAELSFTENWRASE